MRLRSICLTFLLMLVIPVYPSYGQESSEEATEAARIIAWQAAGISPGQHDAAEPGRIVWIDTDGNIEEIMPLPPGTTRVYPCGEQANSPDGRYFVFYVGNDTGTLYLVDESNTIIPLANQVHAMACMGMGTFQFSPDSMRLGFIDYTSDATNQPYASGWLEVYDTATLERVFEYENAVAFDLGEDWLTHISFFTDNDGAAREAAILQWVTGGPEEISTLFSDEGCLFRSGQITRAAEGQLVLIIGQICAAQTEWAMYTVDVANAITNRTLVTGDVPGSYYSTARSNVLLSSPDGGSAFFTYPDGFAQNSTFVQSVVLANIEAQEPLFNNALMPIFTNNPFARTLNANPVLSPDGAWFAMVTNTPNGEATLHAIELGAPDLPPISINTRNRGDTVSAMGFLPDGSQLAFVIGGNNSANNSLFLLDLFSAAESRITRGRYGREIAIAPDGSAVALTNWRIVDDSQLNDYLNLITVDLQTRETTILFEGATIVEGVPEAERQFMMPLVWR